MPKIVLEKNGQTVDEYIIDKQYTLVGRAVGCDLSIADEAISRQHIRIICILNDCFLEDLESANGTLVNGKLTTKCPLEDGDSILIGQHELKYDSAQYQKPEAEETESVQQPTTSETTSQGGPESDSSNLDATVKIDPATLNVPEIFKDIESGYQDDYAQAEDAESSLNPELQHGSRTKAEKPETRTGSLKIVSGQKQGRSISLHKSVTGIDKGGKRVAAVTKRNDGYFLVPVVEEDKPLVKVIVNGKEIRRRIYPLWSSDIIELGESRMEFLLGD